jgi:hypothetical protein
MVRKFHGTKNDQRSVPLVVLAYLVHSSVSTHRLARVSSLQL